MKFRIRNKKTKEYVRTQYEDEESCTYFIGTDGKVYYYHYMDIGYKDGVGAGFYMDEDLEVVSDAVSGDKEK